MQKVQILLSSIGELLKTSRSLTMDQHELATRVGVGRNTISAIENGKAVNVESLLRVFEQLDLLDELQTLIDTKLDDIQHKLSRKARKLTTELENDF